MLLPRRAFWQEFPRFGSRLNWAGMFEMKARWGASVAAIVRRAYDLAIITPGQYKTACIGLSANGWRKREPGEPDVAEKPELAPSIAAMLAKHRPLTRELGLSPKALSELVNADESALIPPQNTVVRLKSPRRPS
jgi:Zn-dependent peptidase ImmA (M78 family)